MDDIGQTIPQVMPTTNLSPKMMSADSRTRLSSKGGTSTEVNRLTQADRSVHDWYRFVLSYPPHLVREYLHRFGVKSAQRVLDPFCGTGTTIVECKKLGIPSIGIEANPMAHFASEVKVDWDPDPAGLLERSEEIASVVASMLEADGIEDNPVFPEWQNREHGRDSLKTLADETFKLLLTNSISPLPLHKTMVLLEVLADRRDERFHRHQRLALAKALTGPIGNLHFGPEVGVGAIKVDTPVLASWLEQIRRMASDLCQLKGSEGAPATMHCADSRNMLNVLEPNSVDAVITSPPYPNEKDYTRTTRLESVLLGFIKSKDDLRRLKRTLLRSNTRGVYKEDTDDRWVSEHPEIQRIAETIETRRLELGKTSGFERLYPRVTKLYFGGMFRHLADLRTILKPGAHLAYVVGDQASYLRVMIRTGQLLADIAQSLGYDLIGIDLFRTRFASATDEQLREEVVVLRWPGRSLPFPLAAPSRLKVPLRPRRRYAPRERHQ